MTRQLWGLGVSPSGELIGLPWAKGPTWGWEICDWLPVPQRKKKKKKRFTRSESRPGKRTDLLHS